MHKKSLLILFILLSKVLYSQTPNKENYLLLNYSLGYNLININTQIIDPNGILYVKKYYSKDLIYFPSISFLSSGKNIVEIELDHLKIENLKSNTTNTSENSLRLFSGIRSSFGMKILSNKSEKKITIGPEIFIYNGWQKSIITNSQNEFKSLGMNVGIVLKKSNNVFKNKYMVQTSLLFEPLRMQLFEKKYYTINIFKRNFDKESYKLIENQMINCTNCGIIQFKFSIGPKL